MRFSIFFAFLCSVTLFLTAGTCSKSESPQDSEPSTDAGDAARVDETSPYEAEILDDSSTNLPPEEIPDEAPLEE